MLCQLAVPENANSHLRHINNARTMFIIKKKLKKSSIMYTFVPTT